MSMKQLAGLISVLGAAGSGYAQGHQVYLDNQRREKADARADEEYQYNKGQRDKAQKLDDDVGAAMADRTVETVTPPDMANADISMAGQQPTQYKVGDQTFADEAQARLATQGVNSQAAKFQRAAQAAAASGTLAGTDRAQVYDALAKKALSEGTDQILTHIQKAAPTVETLKQAGGKMAGAITPEAAEVFNKTGSHWKVTDDAQVVYYLDKDAAGREFVNSRVLNKEGQPVVNDVHHAGLFLQDYRTRMEAEKADTQAFQTGQQIGIQKTNADESVRHNKAAEQGQAAATAAQERVGMAGVRMQGRRIDLEEKQYKDKTVDGQMQQITAALGPLSPEEDKAYRKKLLGVGGNKDQDTALIADLTKKWSENNPTASAKDVATFRGGLEQNFAQLGHNKAIETELKAQFTKNPLGSPGYDTVYKDAIAQLGMTPQQLDAMGYKAPAGAAAGGRVAAGGVRRMPAPPDQMVWEGNSRVVNPAWTEWDKQYGEQYRASEGAKQRRIIAGYERIRD